MVLMQNFWLMKKNFLIVQCETEMKKSADESGFNVIFYFNRRKQIDNIQKVKVHMKHLQLINIIEKRYLYLADWSDSSIFSYFKLFKDGSEIYSNYGTELIESNTSKIKSTDIESIFNK